MRTPIINMDVNVTSRSHAVATICKWACEELRGRYVCVSNVHMCMEVFDHKDYAAVVNASDFIVPDGKPIAKAQRMLGHASAQQVRGEDLTLAICKEAEEKGISVGFFGATDELLHKLMLVLIDRFPLLDITYTAAPPFRAVTEEEDKQFVEAINHSKVMVLFVGLGCPKQELWMSDHKNRLNCVMLGVGAAFDFIAGNKKNAPRWVQSIGMEWFYRLAFEPRRLWKRYFKHNPRFIWYFGLQLLGKDYSR